MNENLFVDERLGGLKRYFLYKPKDYSMFIPDEIRKCVVFICDKNKKPRATGFLVSIQGNNPEVFFVYLVTARHNIVEISNEDFFIRINGKDNQIHFLKGDNSIKWIYHPEHENNPTDIAVIPFSFNTNEFEQKCIPIEMFLKQELIDNGDIGIGNDVFITGLFTHLSGNQKNMPIVRIGNIAMIPNEKVPTKCFGNIEAYLIEARSIGGISGSPVFFCKSPYSTKGINISSHQIFYLGGLIHGHWDTLEDKIDSYIPEEDAKQIKNINMGIAIVTPAFKILETLNCDELKMARMNYENKLVNKNSPTMD